MLQTYSSRHGPAALIVAAVLVEFDTGLMDPDSPTIQIWEEPFVRLADGSWASDAFVAVRRGKAGAAVYAEALHLPATLTSLPSHVRINASLLRSFRGLPAEIVGVTRPRRSFPVAITANPSLWDRDWVSDSQRAFLSPRLRP